MRALLPCAVLLIGSAALASLAAADALDDYVKDTMKREKIPGLSLADADADGAGGPLSGETFTVSISDSTGILSTGGLDSGVSLAFKGTLAEVNAQIAKLTYIDESSSSQADKLE